jgi:hypothetical protein
VQKTKTTSRKQPTTVKGSSSKKQTKAPKASDKRAYGQFKDLDVPALRKLYAEEVGRPTDSDDRKYLESRIGLARRGRITLGPLGTHKFVSEPTHVGFKLEADALDYLDDAWRAVGVKTRVSFIRTAIIEKLQRMLSETKGEERKAVARALDALGVE